MSVYEIEEDCNGKSIKLSEIQRIIYCGVMEMDNSKLAVVLGIIVPEIIELIVKDSDQDEFSATEELYSLLEDEETKLWHLSPLTLYNMYMEERRTCTITSPEEV